jgi:hypothetical protein
VEVRLLVRRANVTLDVIYETSWPADEAVVNAERLARAAVNRIRVR